MQNILKKFLEILLKLFILVFVWVVLNAILNYDSINYMYNPLLIIIYVCIYMYVIKFIYNKLLSKLEKIKFLPILLIIIFAIICFFTAYKLRLNPTWDMGHVFNMALNYIQTGDVGETYLYSCPNNTLLTCIYIILFKFASFIPNVDYIVCVTIFNSVVVISTVILIYLMSRKLFDNRKALLVLMISILTTPFYLHAAIYYSDAISALCACIIFYLYLIIQEKENLKKKIIYEVLLGIFLFIGVQIKIVASFIVIAIFCYNIFNLKIKELFKDFCIVIPVFIILTILFSIFTNKFILSNKDAVNRYKMPMEHYIMIGLKGKGGYNSEYRKYTMSFATYDEKRKANIDEIKRQLEEYNSNTFVKHLTLKLKYAWTDGTYFAPGKLSREPVDNDNFIYKIIYEKKKSDIYKYFPQTMHIAMLIFILINTYTILKNKNYKSKDVILIIAMFGLMLFLLLWENRSRYIFTLVPLMIVLQIGGIEEFSKKVKNK